MKNLTGHRKILREMGIWFNNEWRSNKVATSGNNLNWLKQQAINKATFWNLSQLRSVISSNFKQSDWHRDEISHLVCVVRIFFVFFWCNFSLVSDVFVHFGNYLYHRGWEYVYKIRGISLGGFGGVCFTHRGHFLPLSKCCRHQTPHHSPTGKCLQGGYLTKGQCRYFKTHPEMRPNQVQNRPDLLVVRG